jgi:hypothetical protein
MTKICGFEVVLHDNMQSAEMKFVQPTVVTPEQELAALRKQLDFMTRRAHFAERQLNDVVMAASVKLATARMVLSQVQDKTGQLHAAIEGVLAVLPRKDAPPPQQTQRRLR